MGFLGLDLRSIVARMSLADLSRALFKCHEEEAAEGHGAGVYQVPGFGPLIYCGLQGFVNLLNVIRDKNDLGHPFCGNLRSGNWMAEYIINRLKLHPGTKEVLYYKLTLVWNSSVKTSPTFAPNHHSVRHFSFLPFPFSIKQQTA